MWDGTVISATAGLLTILGGGVAWVARRRDQARPRVLRQAAEVAQASDAVGGALTIVQQSLSVEITRLRDDHAEDRRAWAEQTASDRGRIARLEAAMQTMRRQVDSLTGDLDTVVDALWEQVQHPGSPIARRALAVMHRRRAERAEAPDEYADDGQPSDPTTD